MTAMNPTKSFVNARGTPALILRPDTDRAVRQVIALRGNAKRVRPRGAAFLAWGIGSTVCSSVSASMPIGPDPEKFITPSTWVPLGILVAVLIPTIIFCYRIGRWVEQLTNRIAALEKKENGR